MTVEPQTTGESREKPDDPSSETSGAPSDDVVISHNPATGDVIDEVAVPSDDELQEAVQRARDAQSHWERLPVEERAEYLLEARDVLLDHRKEIRDLVVEETGKAPLDAMAEMAMTCDTLGYYANEGPEMLADETLDLHLLKNKRITVQRSPVGVVLNISPWNFPLDLAITPIVPALIAGNATIVKPSEYTTLTAMRTVELLNRAGLPEGLVQVLPGYGETGSKLIDEADAVSFTGSVETGRKVAKQAADNLIPSTLELGGKDPALVLSDAYVARAANGVVWGAFFNSGQCCMSTERVYVHEDVYEDFVDRVVALTRELRQGDPAEGQVDVGAMTFPDQVDIVERHVQDAVDKGARVVTGGERRDIGGGDFFAPTVLVDVDHDMDIMTEETFGPTLPIMKVPSAAEAIRLANDTPYGLNASIWSSDRDRARRLARQIDSGNVCINDVISSYAANEAPYGGVGDSGIGRRKGAWEVEDFVEPKTVMEDIIGLEREPFWYPYSERVLDTVDKAFVTLFRRGLTDKIKGLFE
jgi:acyl-CoA reductase-like NAD-dependent aldehyde dehydrogenase